MVLFENISLKPKTGKIKVKAMLIACSLFLYGCHSGENKNPATQNFYKNLYTDEILTTSEFEELGKKLYSHYSDSLNNEHVNLHFHFYSKKTSGDSIIRSFKYSIKIGTKYIVREKEYEKIGMKVSPRTLSTLDGNNVTIGGIQEKPTLINLWFIECPGCIVEIPVLNRLQEKYAGRMNFIAITFENGKAIKSFLRKKPFNFVHVGESEGIFKYSEDFIKYIGTNPYPESIFIDTQGTIKFIEGAISGDDFGFKQFDAIIEELLTQK